MRSTLFVGHSHRDASWMERLVSQLRLLDSSLPVEVWDDRRSVEETGGREAVAAALSRARLAVWLLSPEFVASSFAQASELTGVIEWGVEEGLGLVAARVEPCFFQAVPWLALADLWPAEPTCLAELDDAEAEARIAALARDLVGRMATAEPDPVTWLPASAQVRSVGLPVLSGKEPTSASIDAALARLIEAWNDPTVHAACVLGADGAGKSTLLARFLERLEDEGFPGAEAVYAGAFRGEGETSADLVLEDAGRFFGDPRPGEGAPRARGLRLAERARSRRTLLLLDGVDALLSREGDGGGDAGLVRDPGVATLVRELAAGNPGLLVLAGRRAPSDLDDFSGVVRIDLDADSEPTKSIDRRLEALDPAAVQLFDLLGLFDRAADGGAVAALRHPPPIPNLTDRLIDEATWHAAVAALRDAGLLRPEDPYAPGALDASRAVRRRARERLARRPEATTAGHARLFAHYRAAVGRIETAESRRPLHRAVAHGVRAGDAAEALALYRRLRADGGDLDAPSDDLAALSAFYERPWDRPVEGLDAGARAWLDDVVGRRLLVLGRPGEALAPLEAALAVHREAQDWRSAADAAGRLARAFLTLGRPRDAFPRAEEAVELATRSGSLSDASKRRCHLARVLADLGRSDAALEAIREAESVQARRWPLQPRLHSGRGHLFCDLLLDRAAPLDGSALDPETAEAASEEAREICREVADRAAYALRIADENGWSIAVAVARLDLGRARLGLALASGAGDWQEAADDLDAAVHGLQRSAQETTLALAFVARARLRRFRSATSEAEMDLREALALARRGPLRLVECDARLERARLRRSAGDLDAARADLAAARTAVAALGYHRRDQEVAALEAALGSQPT